MAAYQISERKDSQALAQFLQKEGQLLLPMVGLIEQARLAVDELIDVTGRAALEAVLHLSAQGVAGAKHPGKAGGDIRWHGRQRGTVPLSNRKLRVTKPRLRRKAGGEVEVPAYAALQERTDLGARMLEILMHGVSTRHYEKVLPEMAETVGVKKSSVSREWIEASAQTLKELSERRFDAVDIVIVYLDGLIFGNHHVLAAIGVDTAGKKHVLIPFTSGTGFRPSQGGHDEYPGVAADGGRDAGSSDFTVSARPPLLSYGVRREPNEGSLRLVTDKPMVPR